MRAVGEPADPVEPRDEVVVQRLADLASERFAPLPAALDRIGHTVMAAYRASPPPAARRRWLRPRLGLAALAAAVTLASAAAAASAESGPGRPFFGARLAVEQALLPTRSVAERLDAQLVRLDRRLSELAAVPGDPDATRDATGAYRQTLGDIGDLVGSDPSAAERAEQEIRAQLVTIEGLAPRLRPETRRELDAASDDARATLARLRPVEERRETSRERSGPESRAGPTRSSPSPPR